MLWFVAVLVVDNSNNPVPSPVVPGTEPSTISPSDATDITKAPMATVISLAPQQQKEKDSSDSTSSTSQPPDSSNNDNDNNMVMSSKPAFASALATTISTIISFASSLLFFVW